MPHFLDRPLCFLVLFATTAVAILAGASVRALGAEQLPAEIPSRVTTIEELLEETTQAVAKIDRSPERYALLVGLLSDLHAVPFEQRKALSTLFEQDALEITDEQRLFGSRTSFFIASPDLALKFARRTKQQRFREAWLSDLVAYYMSRDRLLGQELLATIETSEFLAAVQIWIARDKSSDFNQVRSALVEAKRLGIPKLRFGSESSVFAYPLSRFANSHLNEIVEFVRSQFPVDDTVVVLCLVASECRRNHQLEVAVSLMKAAAEFVPQSSAPVNPTRIVLSYGYANDNREHAIELFDKYLAEWVSKFPPSEFRGIQASFVGTDLTTVLANAEQVAQRWNSTKDDVLAAAIPQIVRDHGAAFAIQWMQESPSRESAVASIASALKSHIVVRQPDALIIKEWVNILSNRAMQVRDEKVKLWACREVIELAEVAKTNVPEAVMAAYIHLLEQEMASGVASQSDYLRLLPIEKQRAEIERQWQRPNGFINTEVDRIRRTGLSVCDSTLPVEEKRTWFERLLVAARKIEDLNWRASMLSALGTALGRFDPEFSLRVHWEELALAKQLGLKPTMHDWGDSLGSLHALASPEEAIEMTFRHSTAIDERVPSVIWDFARKLEDENDREAVLESIGNLLSARQDYSHAAGVAALLSSPVRQARLSAKIVRARTGKAQAM